jgi:Arc/MetJ family transcription regulator
LGDAVPTNLDIDDRLLNKAKRVGGFRTKKETVTAALEELIARREQRKILSATGTFDFRKDWDYKKDRRGHRC